MSLDTWKEVYYQEPASEVPKSRALEHSLRKWVGLREENLAQHGLEPELLHLGKIRIDASTCALCHHYMRNVAGMCRACPLSTVHDGVERVNCDEQYKAWVYSHDPEPMIELIKLAANKENKA